MLVFVLFKNMISPSFKKNYMNIIYYLLFIIDLYYVHDTSIDKLIILKA